MDSKAIVEVYGKGPNSEIPRVDSAFGGGAVKTFDGTCGALTGGLVAIGCLYGRMKPGDEETKKEVRCGTNSYKITQFKFDLLGNSLIVNICQRSLMLSIPFSSWAPPIKSGYRHPKVVRNFTSWNPIV